MPGLFCLTVDCIDPDTLSTETARRRNDLIDLLHEFQIPSSWTQDAPVGDVIPTNAEVSVGIPRSVARGELVQLLRNMNASMARYGQSIASVTADPHQVRGLWDALVRQGCVVARPRSAKACREASPHIIRGGVWMIPMTCSFVGGSRRSVRSLYRVCQTRLAHAAGQGKLFHVNVDVGSARNSWREETEALQGLLKQARELQQTGKLRIASISQLPSLMKQRRTQQPMDSILRRSAS